MKKVFFIVCIALCASLNAGTLREKIAEKHKILSTDKFYGFERTVFLFEGCKAWIVEPSVPAAQSRPWTWTMQWAEDFVPRTPVLHLLREGWHHVTINTFKYRMNDEGLCISKKFRDYLVGELGFAAKTRLVGMSWGGFFSSRYAARFGSDVHSIYFDCPLMNFDSFFSYKKNEEVLRAIGPWASSVPASWTTDPRMPVNMAQDIARAGIKVFLVYGAQDLVVPAQRNSEIFIERFRRAGGDIKVVKRDLYGHHPHGLEIDDKTIAEFFKNGAK